MESRPLPEALMDKLPAVVLLACSPPSRPLVKAERPVRM
jgi:hypothetical protein